MTYSTIVNKYMYYRTQAVINNDIQLLWNQYPDLKLHKDAKKGVNVEEDEVDFFNTHFQVMDANYSIESHERLKVKTIDKEEVILLIHGGSGYLRDDFSESGGEYLMEITLQMKDDQWVIVKTDESTQSEYIEWFHKNE